MKRIFLIFLILFLVVGVSFAGQKTLTFAWNQEISADFSGWKLYYSTAPNVQVDESNLFATIPYSGTPETDYTSDQIFSANDNAETTYYFVMTAFDTSGNESDPSNEVSETFDFLAPGAPSTFTVTVQSQ